MTSEMYAVLGVGDSATSGGVMSDERPDAIVDMSNDAAVADIPVGNVPTGAKHRRFLPLAVALGVVAVVAVVGAVLWLNFTHSPEYSLAQMASAARSKNWDGIQKYMDVDAVTSNLVDVAVAKTLAQDTSGLGALGAGLAQAMKPVLTQQLKDTLKKSVEEATSTATGGISGVLSVKSPKSVTYVSNDEVLVTLEMPAKSGGTQDIKLRMKRVDDHWRVTAFENAGDLLGSSN